MMENMIGEFAREARRDRHAQAVHDAQVAEVVRAASPDRRGGRMRALRAAIARVLVALAMRLAPPTPGGATLADKAANAPQ